MRNLVMLVVVCVIGWQAYKSYEAKRVSGVPIAAKAWEPASRAYPRTPDSAAYRCDGRTRCSQMTSCAEATYFLKNCPGTKMDGNNDGIPCEQQWCN